MKKALSTLLASLLGTSLLATAAQAMPQACSLVPQVLQLQRGKKIVDVELPAEGSFVEESHYLTTQDKLADVWPGAMIEQRGERAVQCDEGIAEHLERSLALYRRHEPKMTIAELYPEWWQQVWTPREGGHCGQGSIGEEQLEMLTPEEELWLLTMNWAPGTKPEPGTRFLLTYKGRHIVLIAGFESGPKQRVFLGGVTPEVHHYLGTENETNGLAIGYLKDQSLAPGPIDCNRM